jgi:hypothetical protein
MNDEVNAEVEESTPAPTGPAAGIARGRMHAALVYYIKFLTGEEKDGEIARKFATTPGKVNDIRKDRNFKYVTKDIAFTAAEIQEAKDRFTASVNAENSTVADEDRDTIVEDALEALSQVPTTDGESQLATVRKAERKPRGKSKEDAEAEAEGTPEDAGDEDLDTMLEG